MILLKKKHKGPLEMNEIVSDNHYQPTTLKQDEYIVIKKSLMLMGRGLNAKHHVQMIEAI